MEPGCSPRTAALALSSIEALGRVCHTINCRRDRPGAWLRGRPKQGGRAHRGSFWCGLDHLAGGPRGACLPWGGARSPLATRAPLGLDRYRGALYGPLYDVAPMFLFNAPTAGTGKSHLVDLVSLIARGRECPVITAATTDEEM